MKFILIASGVFTLSIVLIFVAPHHRRNSGIDKPCTLGEVYRSTLEETYNGLTEGGSATHSGREAWFIGLILAALWAAAFPSLFVLLAHAWPPIPGRGPIYVLAGLLTLVGAPANFLGMLLSHMVIGFGASSSGQRTLLFIWIIPLFQMAFGLASVAAGLSGRMANCLTHLLA